MSFCINPTCKKPENPDTNLFCQSCGSELLIEGMYRVTRKLGGGGFGITYEVETSETLKVLKVLTLNSSDALRLFQQEAEVLRKLNHPGIPKVETDGYFTFFPKGSNESLHCILMEKIEGQDLESYINTLGKPIKQKLALEWLKQIVSILHVVHTRGLFHRDIKPSNIMLRPNGQLALIDFGTVKEITATVMTSQAKKQGTTVYTPGYAPPEQEKGFTVPQSDFFALGRTFVYLLTGKHPLDFYDPNTDELNWLDTVSGISPQLTKCLDWMMQRLAKKRPADTEAILQRLQAIEKELAPKSDPKTPVSPSLILPKPVKKNRSWGLYFSAFLLIGSLGTLSYMYLFSDLSISKRNQFTLPFSVGSLVGLVGCTYFLRKRTDNFLLEKTLTGHSNTVYSVAISPDGQTLVSGSGDNTIKVWNLATGELIRTLTGHSNTVYSVAISPDGNILVSGSRSEDNTLKIWNLATGELIRTLTDHFHGVCSVAISPDGKTLVSGSGDKTIKIWNLATGELIRTLTGHSNLVWSVAIIPDGQTLVSGSEDKTIKIWNLATGELIRTLTDHSDSVYSVAISPDGNILVSGSGDKTIKIWNLATGKLIRTLTGHSNLVRSVAISPDCKTLVSGSWDWDNTLKIWNLATGELIRTLTDHSMYGFSVAISPDGNTLVSGSGDKTIKIWRRL